MILTLASLYYHPYFENSGYDYERRIKLYIKTDKQDKRDSKHKNDKKEFIKNYIIKMIIFSNHLYFMIH